MDAWPLCGDSVETSNKLPSIYTTRVKICYMYDKDLFVLNSWDEVKISQRDCV